MEGLTLALLIVLSAMVFLLILLIITSFVAFKVIFGRMKKPSPELITDDYFGLYGDRISERLKNLKDNIVETVEIKSYDGLTLRANYIKRKSGVKRRGIMLCMHGFKGSGVRDYASSCVKYLEIGFDVILPDQRAHGMSQGDYLTFGLKERLDCRDWVRYASKRFGDDAPIILCGVSMGATTVLLASGEDLPKNVCAVVADCAFSDAYRQILHSARAMVGIMADLIVPLINVWCKLLADFDLKAIQTVPIMKKCGYPILFIHGENDFFVPCISTKENYEACSSKDKILLLVKEARHAESFLCEEEKCLTALSSLLDKAIGSL